MKYYGVIVDVLTRTTSLIEGEYSYKPTVEEAGWFASCRWFPCGNSEIEELVAEYKALYYEVEMIKMFRKLDIINPSIFANYAKGAT